MTRDAVHRAFPTSRKTMPHPMSLRKARSWPSACGAALSRTTAAKAAAREKTVVIRAFAPEPWGRRAKTIAPAAQQARATAGKTRGTRGPGHLPASETCTCSLQSSNWAILSKPCGAQPALKAKAGVLEYCPSTAWIREEQRREYRRLGETGLMVSELCLGCMTFGRETDEEDSKGLVVRFLDAGGNFIDTADVYSKGVSEEISGRAIRGVRDDVVLATKVRFSMGDGPNDVGLSRKHVTQGCEDSLRRLGTDFIDLYQVHT